MAEGADGTWHPATALVESTHPAKARSRRTATARTAGGTADTSEDLAGLVPVRKIGWQRRTSRDSRSAATQLRARHKCGISLPRPVLLLAPKLGERILDLGCGDPERSRTPGTTTRPKSSLARLTLHDFVVDRITLFERPTPPPAGISGSLELLGGPLLAAVASDDRTAVEAQIENRLTATNLDGDGR